MDCDAKYKGFLTTLHFSSNSHTIMKSKDKINYRKLLSQMNEALLKLKRITFSLNASVLYSLTRYCLLHL
jgi:hypothetical protein